MRIGIVPDIHGNVAGLSAAFYLRGDIDELLCGGELVEEFRPLTLDVTVLAPGQPLIAIRTTTTTITTRGTTHEDLVQLRRLAPRRAR